MQQDTISQYTRWVIQFCEHFWTSAEQLGEQEARQFILHLLNVKHISASSHKMVVAALRFLFRVTLDRQDIAEQIPYPRVGRKQPVVLSKGEVKRLLDGVKSLKYKAIITALYAAGLRISEALRLHVHDIDRARGVLIVREGKGRKDRTVMLSRQLLEVLERYWRAERPDMGHLFPGRTPGSLVSYRSVRLAISEATAVAGIFNKRVTPHVLRHSFATHLIQDGADVTLVQRIMGHSSIRTTGRYIHISTEHVASIPSPLDTLEANDE